MISSPIKEFNRKVLNEPLVPMSRTILGTGRTTVALSDSKNTALIVTTLASSKKIDKIMDLNKGTLSPSKGLISYFKLGSNMNLAELINPTSPHVVKKSFELLDFDMTLRAKNVVYRTPRFTADLQAFPTADLNLGNLTKLSNQNRNALNFLHSYNFSHNDVSRKNVFYTVSNEGENVDAQNRSYTFVLADYGSVTQNEPNLHGRKKNKDLRDLESMITLLREKIEDEPLPLPHLLVQKTLDNKKISEEELLKITTANKRVTRQVKRNTEAKKSSPPPIINYLKLIAKQKSPEAEKLSPEAEENAKARPTVRKSLFR